jgi:catechol 2,3-dioxygenase-like lactoylglutathione lyase family enzyme
MLGKSPLIAIVPTVDADRAQDFYVNKLGLSFITDDGASLVLDANGTTIRLTRVEEHQPSPHPLLGWEVDDMTQVVDQLTAVGVEMLIFEGFGQDERGVWTGPDGTQLVFFSDPDGNSLYVARHAP